MENNYLDFYGTYGINELSLWAKTESLVRFGFGRAAGVLVMGCLPDIAELAGARLDEINVRFPCNNCRPIL